MKSSKPNVSSSLRVSSLCALLFCLLPFHSVQAGNDYWSAIPGTSVDTNWNTAANWTGTVQTYFSEVEFAGGGANPNTVFAVNNVLNSIANPGVSQMPIYELDYIATNGNYTTLINPGITLTLNTSQRGYLDVGADILHTTSPAPANAAETITIQGSGAELSMAGNLYVAQGSTTPNDTHNVTLDLSGLDNFVDNGNDGTANYIYVASSGAPRSNGNLYLAKTNAITLGNGIQICNQSYSNSMPVAVYLGIQNSITLGSSGNLTVGGTGTTTAGAFLKFNPAFLGGANPPAVTFGSAASNGRINNFFVCNNNGAPEVPGSALCDLSGGAVNALLSNLQVALSGTGAANANGVLTFDNGLIDTTSAFVGRQQNSAGGFAAGTVNINSNSTYGASALLRVDGTLSLAAVTTTLTPGTAGTININGGALSAATITCGTGASAINSTLGSITLSGTAGTLSSPLTSLSLTNSTLNLNVLSGATNLVVTTLTTGGATNIINIVSAPPAPSYPLQVPLVKYLGSFSGAGYNFALGTLPALCVGYITNDIANSSVDLVLTTGPVVDVWNGAISGNWDFATANWTGAGAVDYANGNFVVFPDGATTGTVSLTTTVMPAGITVTNNSLAYTFNGGGAVTGSTALLKTGPGTLVIDNSGNNTFTGGVTISSGALQVGNGDTSGNLPGAIANSGILAFDRTDTIAVPNTISGSGLVAEAGGGTLQMSGANIFTGQMLVTNNSTLQLGSSSGAGVGTNSLVIANGSTLDVNGYAGYRPILVSGTGVNGNGAIINSGGAVYDSGYGIATNVTLTGDATFNVNNNRWDLGAPNAGMAVLSTGGHPYNLTLESAGYFEWKNLAVDTNLANINLMSGTWGLVGTTAFGNPNSTLTVASGAALDFYGSAVSMNKQVDFQDGTINNPSGNNVMKGGLILESGFCSFDISGGTSLTISNVLTGSGVFYQESGSGSSILDGNSPNFTGGVQLYAGQMTLNGTIGSGITSQFNTTLAGSGVASNLVDVAGALLPGGASTVGTFTAAGGLTLESTATLTMDLGSSASVGGNTSDLLAVVGNLTVNGNNITINPVAGTLANGAYTLFTYTGTLSGSFGTASTVSSSRYSFAIDTSVPNLVRLIVSGVPNLLVWNNGSDNSQWDVQSSLNWTNLTTHTEDQFFTADAVTFDDSINSAKFPSTSVVIPSGQVVAPSFLTNNSTANYTISGSGKISGAAQIVKQGAGTLTLGTTNDFSGGISIQGGTVVAHTNAALGSAIGAITITNGTLDVDYALGAKPVFVSGAGVGGNGALVNNGGAAVYDSGAGLVASVTLTGNTTFGGNNRWDLGVRGTTGTVLSTGGNPFNLTVTGSAGLYFEWDNLALDTNLANITIMPGITLGTIGATTYGNPTNTLTISSNATLVFYNDGSATPVLNKQVQILNGGTLENGGGATPVEGPVILGVNSGDLCDFNIGGTSLSVSNVISGAGSLLKVSSGSPLYLSATNTYTGNTVVSNGVLALTGNGSISTSPGITVVSGATVDVSGRADQTLTLASGQTLQGNGTINGGLVVGAAATVSPGGLNAIGTLTVTNTVILSGTTLMEVNKTALTHDQITAGANGITYGGTLTVTNLAGTLAANDSFKLFSAGSYNGAFAAIVPATPGAGLMWNTNTLSSGVLTVAAVVSVPPTISGITVSGASFVITGTNNTGTAGTYHLLTTTNLAISLTNWVVLTNGSFGGNGSFAATNAIGTNAQQFFILQEP